MDFVCHLGTPEGRVVRETRAAANETVLRAELERQGLKVFAIERRLGLAMPTEFLARFRRERKIPYRTLMVFNQEMAALLKAGLPLLQALNLMLERMREPNFREILTQVRDRVKGGEELSDAFGSFGAVFPPLYSATLKAGERTGELEQVLRRFIRYLKLVIDARKRVISALVYPSVLVGLSIAMLFVMAIFVMPRFTVFYDSMDMQLPLLTRITLGVSLFLRDNIVFILAGTIATVVVVRRWARTPAGALRLDRMKLRIPLLGPVLHLFSLAEYCRSLSTLLAGGMPLLPSMEISGRAVSNLHVRDRLFPTLQQVREGTALHEALDKTGIVTDLAIDMVKVGEATGSLDVMLTNIADFFDEEVELRMQRILSLVEPLMLVIMGCLVAALLISVYMPMFNAMGGIT
ncbi:MAG: type II secretion system F family protein [Thermoanaerobaculia bacterium]|nr:type II secretion system F family protein [Thermoanaerobaculia bacterium]MBP9824047.1 type II secretion system F family protein [Thermoanaerobaculia bacterium]